MTQIKPLSSMETPRFADVATFFRLPVVKDLNKLDSIIYTSGLGGLFKPGIPIGKISKDSRNKVNFFSDFTQLNYIKIASFSVGDKN